MEELLAKYDLNQIIFISSLFGMILIKLIEILFSFIDYIRNKAWLVKDYERIIAKYLEPYFVNDMEDKELICFAKNEYENSDKILIFYKIKNWFKKTFKKSSDKNE